MSIPQLITAGLGTFGSPSQMVTRGFTSSAAMTDYYVAPSGTNGTGTLASPWVGFANINWGAMVGGDSITLMGGTYTERFDIQTSGLTALPFRLNAGGNGVIVDMRMSLNGLTTMAATTKIPTDLSAWQLVAGTTDLYKKGSGDYTFNFWTDGVLIQPMPTSLSTNTEANVIAAITAGQWTQIDAVTSGLVRTIYWKSPDGRAPASYNLQCARRDIDTTLGSIYASGRNNLEFSGKWIAYGRNCNTTNDGGIYLNNCNNVTVVGTGYLAGYLCQTGVRIKGGSNCKYTIVAKSNVGIGIAMDSISGVAGTDYNATGILLQNSEISDNGNYPRYNGTNLAFNADCDGVGMGHNGGTQSNIVFRNSRFLRNGPAYRTLTAGWTGTLGRGSGIYLGTANTYQVKNFSIIGCTFDGNMRIAINVGDECDGFTLQDSLITRTKSLAAFPLAAVRILAPTGTNALDVDVENTIFVQNENETALRIANSDATVAYTVAFNQFDINATPLAVTQLGDLYFESATANYSEHDNVFFGTNPGRFLYRSNATTYTTVAAWNTATTQGVGDSANPNWTSTWPGDASTSTGTRPIYRR